MTKKTIKPQKMLAGGIIKAAVKAGGKAIQAANSPQPPAARGRGLFRAISSAVNKAQGVAVEKAKGGSVTKKPKKKV